MHRSWHLFFRRSAALLSALAIFGSAAPAQAANPPVINLMNKPAQVTPSTMAYFLFPVTATHGLRALDCRLDAGAYAPCWFQQYYFNLGAGAHTITIRATDYQNQQSSVSYAWSVGTGTPPPPPADTTGPSTPAVSHDAGSASATGNVSVTFSASDTSGIRQYQCQLDGGVWESCQSPKAYGPLAEGRHTIRVKATDNAGNVSGEGGTSVLVDRTAPSVSFTSTPAATTSSLSATFGFAATDVNGSGVAQVTCKSSEETAYVPCSNSRSVVMNSTGTKTMSVQAVDAAGNRTVREYGWTIVAASATLPSASASTVVSGAAASPAPAKSSAFRMFLSMSYPGIPKSLPQDVGAAPLNCFNPTPFVFDQAPHDGSDVPTVSRMKQGVAQMVDWANRYGDPYWPFGDAEHLCLDWENFWNLAGQASIDIGDSNLTVTRAHLKKFAESARRFRQALNESGQGHKKFGFYGVAPIDAWSTYLANPGSSLFQRQTLAHHLPEMAEVVQAVDYLTTTTYLPLNPTSENWAHVENTLKLAREIAQGKPLYVFVWPQFAGGTGYMDRASWLRQLDLARRYADGVIIWGSYQLPGADRNWNVSSPWWQTALEWMRTNR